jgi:enediyne polyketide synthase
VEALLPIARSISRAELTDLAAALAKGENGKPKRLALVADSPWDLEAQLHNLLGALGAGRSLAESQEPERGVFAGTAQSSPRWVALFPGQGSQFLNMGCHLRARYPFVADLYNEAEAALSDFFPQGLQAVSFKVVVA